MEKGGNGKAFEPGRETEVDPVAIVAASCRHATARLPRGRLGAATAEEVARGLAVAVSRRLPDITGSPTEVFAALVGRQVLGEMPCPRVRGPALRLLAQVTPLVASNGSRRWNLWLETALDPRSDIFSKVRSSKPGPRDGSDSIPNEGEKRRVGGIDERQELIDQLAAEKRRGHGLFEEREALSARLVDVGQSCVSQAAEIETLQRSISDLTRERDEMRADLFARRNDLREIYRRLRDEFDTGGPEPSRLESAWRIIEQTRDRWINEVKRNNDLDGLVDEYRESAENLAKEQERSAREIATLEGAIRELFSDALQLDVEIGLLRRGVLFVKEAEIAAAKQSSLNRIKGIKIGEILEILADRRGSKRR